MKNFTDNTDAFARLFEREVARAVEEATFKIAGDIEDSINRYQVTRRTASGNRVGTSPSKPGDPPKMVTGTLKGELDSDTERTQREVIGRIGYRRGSPAAKYAEALEYGTRRMAARPFLRPGLDRGKPVLKAELRRIRS